MRANRALFVAVTALTLCCLAGPVASAAIVAHYTFDDSGDLFNDSSPQGNDGSARTSDPAQNTATVKVGTGSLDLDGNDSANIDAVAADVPQTEHTLSLWLYSSQDGGQRTLIAANTSGGGNNMLTFARSNVFQLHSDPPNAFIGVGGTQIAADDPDTLWHHVVYTRSGDVGTIYVDGVLDAAPFTASYVLHTSDQWSIGQEFDGGSPSDFYTGLIDDVQIYDNALVAWQVQHLFDNPGAVAPVPEPATMLIWSLLAGLGVALGWRRRK